MISLSERIGDLSVPQAESWFLGSVLLKPEKLMDITVSEKHFYGQNNRLIFQVIQNLELQNKLVDVVTVDHELQKKTGRSWLAMLGQYANNVIGDSFFESSQMVMRDEFKNERLKKSL